MDDLLQILKLNLSLTTTAYDTYLTSLIAAAQEMIAREGVTLGNTDEDNQIVVMYAAYLFRKRADDNPVMPRMLRYALNNRLFAQMAGETNGTTE